MPNGAKNLLELASIELAYARLEIRYADQSDEVLNRIAFHLDEMKQLLTELARRFEGNTKAIDETAPEKD